MARAKNGQRGGKPEDDTIEEVEVATGPADAEGPVPGEDAAPEVSESSILEVLDEPDAAPEQPEPNPDGTDTADDAGAAMTEEIVADDVAIPADPTPEVTEPATVSPSAQAAAPAARRGGFLPSLLGGAIAAGLGFGAAAYVLPRFMPAGPAPEALAGIEAAVDAQAKTVEDLKAGMASLQATDPAHLVETARTEIDQRIGAELASLRESLAGLGTRLDAADTTLAGLEDRLSGLEKRPVEGGAASASALEAFGREMEAFRTQMEAEKAALAKGQESVANAAKAAEDRLLASEAEAATAREEAAASARRADARTALGKIEAAFETGAPLDTALAELSAAGVTVPAALSSHPDGVPSLAALKDAFPAAARAAISTALKVNPEGSTGFQRFASFLKSQTGARSLTPREGSDPDAILSRAEAALGADDLPGALAEIAALPEAGKAEMADWVALAQARIDAKGAIDALAAELK